jgi:hypothetical protein
MVERGDCEVGAGAVFVEVRYEVPVEVHGVEGGIGRVQGARVAQLEHVVRTVVVGILRRGERNLLDAVEGGLGRRRGIPQRAEAGVVSPAPPSRSSTV